VGLYVLLAHCHIRSTRKFTILKPAHISLLKAKRDFAFMIYAGLAGYYQSFAFLVTPVIGVTLSYSEPNELDTATGVLFLTWSIWFTFITSLIALRSEYTVYLTLIFASVAITTGLVRASHLVAATSEQVPAFRLQRVYVVPCCEMIPH
jgi:succinate-acetate transporter protein